MLSMTTIARVIDGLPLAASTEDDQTGRDLQEYKTQAKQLFKRLSDASPTRCSIESGSFVFHYIIEDGVCLLTLCEPSYPKKLAFAFLEDMSREFQQEYRNEIHTASRPYAFISFDTTIQRLRKQYSDTRAARNVSKLNDDLMDVQRIMIKNIDEVIGRGQKLDQISQVAGHLSSESKKYVKDAKWLNILAMFQKYIPIIGVVVIVLLVLYLRYVWFH
ncbi:hypothetical protein CAOG_05907 [Capsaspora owczarzaki ATCC 30864]|uniref:Vesicle-trafficking protein SEC22b n=1 Tax=Capsaspora owczarzaki (strain ATCC 30864) TaxID=595528 RepID=A0A0D2WUA0_CAPO3|nr:hypothetical protein CAOG_05907 [Capsaspora owczarzaki ATCC 30864]KJE95458.1 hypothetical protein CAOG_005907 [Capsaspora owczarzaki ATCC 30864]|eukprot:XP_004345497.1 hypothetical protein CAOG_05907 [Capsaspora owczarzaki ATCC 30864]